MIGGSGWVFDAHTAGGAGAVVARAVALVLAVLSDGVRDHRSEAQETEGMSAIVERDRPGLNK